MGAQGARRVRDWCSQLSFGGVYNPSMLCSISRLGCARFKYKVNLKLKLSGGIHPSRAPAVVDDRWWWRVLGPNNFVNNTDPVLYVEPWFIKPTLFKESKFQHIKFAVGISRNTSDKTHKTLIRVTITREKWHKSIEIPFRGVFSDVDVKDFVLNRS